MAGSTFARWQLHQQAGAYLAGPPGVHLFQAFRQGQSLAALKLREAVAGGVVDDRRAQGRVVRQARQQGVGRCFGGQRLAAQFLGGEQFAERVHGLGGNALAGNPVGGTDEREVGNQQNGCQQDEHGDQQFAADRKVFELLAQIHGKAMSGRMILAG